MNSLLKNIKVSVIVPVYNVEPYLRRCLDSLINQTLKDIEIICINDCSPDNSLAILKEYAAKDNRVKIINFRKNKGVGIARNTGIKAAKGKYMGFVDSDDYVDLDYYEKLYKKAIVQTADVVIGSLKHKKINQNMEQIIPQTKRLSLTQNAIYRAKMLRDNGIKYPEKVFHFWEDLCFFVHWSIFAKKIFLQKIHITTIPYMQAVREASL
jgi:glycosyltransferase involved in cell wall biosynthesis